MAREDVLTMLKPTLGLANSTNAAILADATGPVIDLKGEMGGVFLVTVPAITGGSIAMAIEAGDAANLSDATDVTDVNHLDTDGPITAPGSYRIAYYGIQRYIRLKLTSGNATGSSAFAVYASAPTERGAPPSGVYA